MPVIGFQSRSSPIHPIKVIACKTKLKYSCVKLKNINICLAMNRWMDAYLSLLTSVQ